MRRLEDDELPPRAGVPREWSTKVWWRTPTWYGVAVPAIVVGIGADVVVVVLVVVVDAPPPARRLARRSRSRIGRSPNGAISGNLRGRPVVVVVGDVGVGLCAPAGPMATAAAVIVTASAAAARGRTLTDGGLARARRRRRASRRATRRAR